MTINEYQKDAMRTVGQVSAFPIRGDLLNALMGLCGESGEAMDALKKHLFQGHEFDRMHMAEELGDVAWYLVVGANALDFTLEDILRMNVEKRKQRYPDGFDGERSVNRREINEDAIRDINGPFISFAYQQWKQNISDDGHIKSYDIRSEAFKPQRLREEKA